MSKGGKHAKPPEPVKTVIPIEKLNLLRKRPLTKKRQKIFLAEFAKTFNVTKAAYAAGITRGAVYQALKADSDFKKQFEEVKQAKLDTIEEASLIVATQPDARGFNDRKLLLQAHRPEVYNPTTQIKINQTLTIETAPQQVAQLFQSVFQVKEEIEDAEVVDETNLKAEKRNTGNDVSKALVKRKQ